jgi:hypothetical protein
LATLINLKAASIILIRWVFLAALEASARGILVKLPPQKASLL